MQRTLNRELKELEVVGREAIVSCGERCLGWGPSQGDTLVPRGETPWDHPTSVKTSSWHRLEGCDASDWLASNDTWATRWYRKLRGPIELATRSLRTR